MMTIGGVLLLKSKMVLVPCIAVILISQLSASIKWLRNFSLHNLTLSVFFFLQSFSKRHKSRKTVTLAKVMICYGLNKNLQNGAFRKRKENEVFCSIRPHQPSHPILSRALKR